MTVAVGVSKKIGFVKESTWGVAGGPTGGKYLRRVTGDFNLNREVYESSEIRTDFQTSDSRLGIKSAEGTLNGELSPGSYAEFMQSVVARDFTAVTALTGLSVTIATSGLLFTITRSTGSFLTDGIHVGSVIRLSGAGLNAANAGNNALVVSMSALVLTVKVLSGTSYVAEGPIASVGLTVQGKQTYAPLSGHTDDSYTIEEWYSDIAQSEVYTGMKVGTMNVQLPTTGLVTVDFSMMGKDREITGTTQYLTTPTAAGNEGIFASVSGALLVNGAVTGLVTSMDFSVTRAQEAANVIGQNTSADIFTGRITASGNFSTYFLDGAIRDYFDDETVITLVVALTTGSEKDAESMSFTFPRVKLGSYSRADGELGIIASSSFTALLNDVTTAGLPATTVQIQDSALV